MVSRACSISLKFKFLSFLSPPNAPNNEILFLVEFLSFILIVSIFLVLFQILEFYFLNFEKVNLRKS